MIHYEGFKNIIENRPSKTLSILHRGFDKIKQGGRVMVLDEKSS